MLTGGASIGYAKILLERENAAVFISGYTDEESPLATFSCNGIIICQMDERRLNAQTRQP
jgi:hypothetical protein